MNRRTAIALLAGASLSACRSTPRRLRVIKVASVPRFTVAPLYLADERGYFRDAGLQLDVQLTSDTTQMIPLLAGGRIDVAFGAASAAAFNAVAKGARTRIVAAREIAVLGCTHEIHGRRASFPGGFQDAAELNGKRVAVTSAASLTAFLLDAFLASAGLQPNDVQRLIMRVSESTAALVAGKLDAVVDLDRTFSSPDIVVGPSLATLLPGFQYSYAHFGQGLLDEDVGVGAAFLAAYLRGVREFRAGATPAGIEQIAAGSGMDSSAVHTACRDRMSPDGAVDTASIQRMIDWCVDRGFLPAPIDASLTIDSRFLDRARRERTS